MTIRSPRGEPLRHEPAVLAAVQPTSSEERRRRRVELPRGRRVRGDGPASATVRKSRVFRPFVPSERVAGVLSRIVEQLVTAFETVATAALTIFSPAGGRLLSAAATILVLAVSGIFAITAIGELSSRSQAKGQIEAREREEARSGVDVSDLPSAAVALDSLRRSEGFGPQFAGMEGLTIPEQLHRWEGQSRYLRSLR